MRSGWGECTGSVGNHEYVKAFLNRGQCGECHAHFSYYAGDNQLFFAGRFHEIFVIPSVDVAGAGDIGRIGEHLFQFGHQWAVRTAFKAGGQNGRQVEVFGQISSSQHVVFEFVGVDVAYQRKQAGLVVDQQHRRVVFIQTFVSELFSHFESPYLMVGVKKSFDVLLSSTWSVLYFETKCLKMA